MYIVKDMKNSLSCFGGDRTGSSLQASLKDWCLELQYHQEGVEDIPLLSCWRKIWDQDSNKQNQVLHSCSLWWNIMKQMGKKLQCNNLPHLQVDSINLDMPDRNLWNEDLSICHRFYALETNPWALEISWAPTSCVVWCRLSCSSCKAPATNLRCNSGETLGI